MTPSRDFLSLLAREIVELVAMDGELRDALIRLIKGKAAHEEALAACARKRREK